MTGDGKPATAPAAGEAVTVRGARAAWAALEPVHAQAYFTPEGQQVYAAAGLDNPLAAYVAPRAAPMGAVGAGPVAAAFYNFNPAAIGSVVPRVWEKVSPDEALAARWKAVDAGLRAHLGDAMADSAEIAEAAQLARRAAEGLSRESAAGRPLYAAHADVEWPADDAPHLVLWHAASLIREFRGDGHIALLVEAELDPVEALVSHAAAGGPFSARALRKLRVWSEQEWAAGLARLVDRGLAVPGSDPDSPALTDKGRTLRAELEDRTDDLALPALAALTAAEAARLTELTAPAFAALADAGVLPGTRRKSGS
ncbi:SCO6745 family protein [Nocardiopsis coralliicola]